MGPIAQWLRTSRVRRSGPRVVRLFFCSRFVWHVFCLSQADTGRANVARSCTGRPPKGEGGSEASGGRKRTQHLLRCTDCPSLHPKDPSVSPSEKAQRRHGARIDAERRRRFPNQRTFGEGGESDSEQPAHGSSVVSWFAVSSQKNLIRTVNEDGRMVKL